MNMHESTKYHVDILRKLRRYIRFRYENLAPKFVCRCSLIVASLFRLRGVRFGWFGLQCAKRCRAAGQHALAFAYSTTPVSCVRYFEFAAAEDALQKSLRGRALDLSSPRLFSAYILSRYQDVSVDIVNPDKSDLADTDQFLGSLSLDRNRYRLHSVRGEALPWADGTFNAIWTISVLEHIPETDAGAVLRELERVLAPGGRLFISVPVSPTHREEYRPQNLYGLDGLPVNLKGDVFFQYHYDEDSIKTSLVDRLPHLTAMPINIWGERIGGWFEQYESAIQRKGAMVTCLDPLLMRFKYCRYKSYKSLVHDGVACVEFVKEA